MNYRLLRQICLPALSLLLAACGVDPMRDAESPSVVAHAPAPKSAHHAPLAPADDDDANDSDGPPASSEIPAGLAETPDAVPRNEPKSATGNPDSYVALGQRYEVLPEATNFVQIGIASWYGKKFQGKRTSSGEAYDMFKMTAAHKTLPIPCYARITNRDNGKSVVVRINDRGPFHSSRIIDVSYAAAAKLGLLSNGSAPVTLQVVTPDNVDSPLPGQTPTVLASNTTANTASKAAAKAPPKAAGKTAAKPAPAAAPVLVAAATKTAPATDSPADAVAAVSKTTTADTAAPATGTASAAAGQPAPAAAATAATPNKTVVASNDGKPVGKSGSRYLQAGTFRDPINAVSLRSILTDLGIKSVELRNDDKSTAHGLYRVLIGPFVDPAVLEATRTFLSQRQFSAIPVSE